MCGWAKTFRPTDQSTNNENIMNNYPDDINQYNDDPKSPLYDDRGLERAHTIAVEHVERDAEYVAMIISELPPNKYDDMVNDIMRQLSGLGYLAMFELMNADCDAFQLLIAKSLEHLPVEARDLIDEAIGAYVMEALL